MRFEARELPGAQMDRSAAAGHGGLERIQPETCSGHEDKADDDVEDS